VTYPQVASLGCCFIPALQAAQSSAVWAELVCKKTLTLDFPNLDYIFISVNHSNTHWALISVSIKEKIIRYYDSLKWNDRGIMKLVQDHLTSISLNPDKEEWRTEICSELPIQTNTFDCGVFLCQYAYCIASGKSFNYLTENTRNLRQLMHNEFLEGKVREGNSTEEKPLDKGKSEARKVSLENECVERKGVLISNEVSAATILETNCHSTSHKRKAHILNSHVPSKKTKKIVKVNAGYPLLLAPNVAQQEAIRREKATKVTVLRRKLLRKEETIKNLKKELQLSKEREINLQKKLANHIKVEDRAADGEVGATFLINQVRHE